MKGGEGWGAAGAAIIGRPQCPAEWVRNFLGMGHINFCRMPSGILSRKTEAGPDCSQPEVDEGEVPSIWFVSRYIYCVSEVP